MAVSNSFVIYKLHWESKQLRLNKHDSKTLREHNRFEALKKKFLMLHPHVKKSELKSIRDLEEAWSYHN